MKVLLVHTPFNIKRPLTIIAWLIRKVTKTHWNHCAILIKIDGVDFIIESDIKGVTMLPLKNWAKEQEVAVYGILEGSYRRNKILEKVGKVGYSFKDLFWFMPVYLITGQFYGQKVDGYSNKPTCYEFAAWWLDMQDWYMMTPANFKKQLEDSKVCTGLELIIDAKKL
jgi:hypothetical protein